jgi:hypothetical protein
MPRSILDAMAARVSGDLARDRMREKFAPTVVWETTEVAGAGLARVEGELVRSTVGDEHIGAAMEMTNIGRPAVALYAPAAQGGISVYGAGGGATVVPPTGGTTGAAKPYATKVVAASDSIAHDAENADYVCDGVNDQEQISLAIANGGRVILLDGTYNISAAIVMHNDVEIVGAGVGMCSIKNTAFTPHFYSATQINHFAVAHVRLDCLAQYDIIAAPLLRCRFDHVTFAGAGVNAQGACVNLSAAERVRFHDCEFRDSLTGILVDDADEVEIHHCRFFMCSTDAVRLLKPRRCKILGSTFYYCGNAVTLGETTL